jgi:hypothetical protein
VSSYDSWKHKKYKYEKEKINNISCKKRDKKRYSEFQPIDLVIERVTSLVICTDYFSRKKIASIQSGVGKFKKMTVDFTFEYDLLNPIIKIGDKNYHSYLVKIILTDRAKKDIALLKKVKGIK